MYQPKIREDLIARMYRAAHLQGIPMTTLVAMLLEQALDTLEEQRKERLKTQE